MKYFTIKELCKTSHTNINNEPTSMQNAHIVELIDKLLDPLREAYGRPIVVTSGFRCARLNKLVGGASNSSHMYGFAADLKPKDGNMKAFQAVVMQFAKTHTGYDQIILEHTREGLSTWIHVGIRRGDGSQRRQVLKTTDGKTYLRVPI